MHLNSKCEALHACARPLDSAESSRETRLLDHCRETPLRLAAAPLACYFYCCDPGAINQPVVGPSAQLLPSPPPQSPFSELPKATAASTTPLSDRSDMACICEGSAAAQACAQPQLCVLQITVMVEKQCSFPVFPRATHVALAPSTTFRHTPAHLKCLRLVRAEDNREKEKKRNTYCINAHMPT